MKSIKSSNNIYHAIHENNGLLYYQCNRAVGNMSPNTVSNHKITCKNCHSFQEMRGK